jgi:hypothetical protein
MVTGIQEVVLQSIVPSRKVEGGLQEILGLVGRRQTIFTRKCSRTGGMGILFGEGVETSVRVGSPDRSGLWGAFLQRVVVFFSERGQLA